MLLKSTGSPDMRNSHHQYTYYHQSFINQGTMSISAQLLFPICLFTVIPAIKLFREGVFYLTCQKSGCSQKACERAPVYWSGSRAPALWRWLSSFLCVTPFRPTEFVMTPPNLVCGFLVPLRISSLKILFQSHLWVCFRNILNAS